jgi:hypothetical protein
MPASDGDKTKKHLIGALIRSIKAFGLHLLFGLLVFGIIYWLTNGFESASEQLRNKVSGTDDAETAVLVELADARFTLMQWAFISLIVSWIMSTVFLYAAERLEPRTDIEAQQRFGVWGTLLILTLGLSTLMWWRSVSLAQIAFALMSDHYTMILATSFAATALGYYLSTALFVKNAVKSSVPGARAFPSSRR